MESLLDHASEGYKQGCMVIGEATAAWAWAETVLGSIIIKVFHERGGSTLEPEPPVSLKRRVAFFRKWLAISSLSESDRQLGRNLADEVSKLAEKRHWLTHGVASEILRLEVGKDIEFLRLSKDGSGSTERATFTQQEIEHLSQSILALAINLSIFLGLVLEHEPMGNNVKNALRKLGWKGG